MNAPVKIEMKRLTFEAALSVDDAGSVAGIAWPWSPDRGNDEILREGVTVDRLPLPMLNGHDGREVIGVWDEINHTPIGIEVVGRLLIDDIQKAKEIRGAAAAGLKIALSIGFIPGAFEIKRDGGFLFKEAHIVEISCVAVGMHAGAHLTTVRELPTETKGGPPMPNTEMAGVESAITKAVEPIAAQLKSFEGLPARIDGIEARLNKTALVADGAAADATAVRKALGVFARTQDISELKSLSVDSQEDGGYLVLPTVEAGIRTIAQDVSPLARLASSVTIGTDSYEILIDTSGVESGWVSEKQTRPETSGPTIKSQVYPVHEVYAQPKATQKILDDASMDVGAWLEGKIAQEFARKEGDAYTAGDGVGKPKGILAYGTASTKDFTREWGVWQHIAAGATSPTDEQLADALIKMSMTLRTPYRSNARWLMSRETATRVRSLKDSNKTVLWFNQPGLTEDAPNSLLGFPVEFDDGMPAIGSGQTPVALGDWSQGYVVVNRVGIRIVRDAISSKPYTLFYTTKRVGGGAVDFNAAKFLKISAN